MINAELTRRQLLLGQRPLTELPLDQRGATAIEYGLIAALIGLLAMPAMSLLGTRVRSMFTCINQGMRGSMNGYCKARARPRRR